VGQGVLLYRFLAVVLEVGLQEEMVVMVATFHLCAIRTRLRPGAPATFLPVLSILLHFFNPDINVTMGQ
jgi:hypothetical protein